MTQGWNPTYRDPDNALGYPDAEPCHCLDLTSLVAAGVMGNTVSFNDPNGVLIDAPVSDPDDDFDEPLGNAYCGLDGPCESCT